MRVLRVYHAGRDRAHRERDRALVARGVELTLVVPTRWPESGSERILSAEPFEVVEVDVLRPGDVNRHRIADPALLSALVTRLRPDVVDLHEEPFSAVLHQVTGLLPPEQCLVAYTAQNLDKRFPPPYAQRERAALGRLHGLYPCSAQAASVAVGKGFRGVTRVLPLGTSPALTAGDQQLPDAELRLLMVGRFIPEKGLLDAVRVLAALQTGGPTTLTLVGAGPEVGRARDEAGRLGVGHALTHVPWMDIEELAGQYRRAHVLLTPSRATGAWVEQFGRVVVEAQSAGAVVVGYRSGALPEVVGGAGVLVAEGDARALAAAVSQLRADPAAWRSLRERGLGVARSRSWATVAEGQDQLYETATGVPRRYGPVRAARVAARQLYGPPATTRGIARPFALPLRREALPGTATAVRAVLAAAAPRGRPVGHGRIRVVFLDHVALLSGGELALLRLIAAMPEVDAHVVLGEDGPLRAELEAAGVRVEVLAMNARARDARRDQLGVAAALRSGLTLVLYTARLAHRLRTIDPDVVHTNSLKSGYYGSVAARLARAPVVWHVRDRIAPDYLPAPAVAVTRWVLEHLPDVVVANSAETQRTTGLAGTHVLHDPYVARQAGTPRRSQDTFVVGIVGRLAPWKGQDVLVRALAHPGLEGALLRITGSAMFGEDAWEAELRRLVAELGLQDRVTFVGFTADVEAELARLDVLVHASVLPEPFGQVVVEGMAAGLPVVAAGAGGPAEIITDGVDGLLVAPGDDAALAAALVRLRSEPATRARLGVAAQVRSCDFAPEVIGQRMTSVYRQVLGARVP